MSDSGGNRERTGFLYDRRAVTFNGLAVCAGWALAAARAARRAGFMRRGMQVMERVAGAVFIAFGVRLAFTDSPAVP